MKYREPTQPRSKVTQERFLTALSGLLEANALSDISVDDIALKAGLTHAAFMKRFGSKDQAVFLLFETYAVEVDKLIATLEGDIDKHRSLIDVLQEVSMRLEAIIATHFSANRAMFEMFQRKLETHPLTKQIFRNSVQLFHKFQNHFLEPGTFTEAGAWASTQLLVTLNFNYLMGAMPGLPREAETRHQFIARLLETTIRV